DRPARPLPGLEAIFNVAPPTGGGDVESPEVMRTAAPRSTLALGRIVSLADLVAEAQRLPGTVMASARWTWDRASQRAAAVVWFVGAELDAPGLHRHLQSLADPELRFSVRAAVPQPRTLSLDVELDARVDPEPAEASLADALVGDDGFLRPEQLGIAQPLVRSELLARIYGVAGVARVRRLALGDHQWDGPAEACNDGMWLDFVERGRVVINGREVTGG
ncbi:MAG: hypothetical protein KC731_36455, partial [Myxococcales bacterium]|nr:hypothetical protein [Myxococcales bacterium]